MESMHVVESKTSDLKVLLPLHSEAHTDVPQPGSDGASVKTRPWLDVPPIRICSGANGFTRLRRDGLEKSIPAATDAVSIFIPR